jgi:hypothetical protein
MGNLQFFNLKSDAGGGVTDVTATPPITSTGGTTPDISTSMNTDRLIGRSSAGVGVMEEIVVGDGLELALGVLTNTATPTPSGYYGAFQDDNTQSANADNVGVAMIFRTTDLSNGVSIVSNGTNLTRITFAHTGIYNLQFSSQFQNIDNAQHDVTIWLRKNGIDVEGTSGFVDVPVRKNPSNFGHVITSWNYLLDVVGGDYFELIWSTTNYQNITMEYYPAGNPPPSTASVILTVTQQSGIMAGTGITALNGLTSDVQTFATGTTGTDFNISSSGSTHTFNIPSASNLARGLVSILAQTFAGVKTFLSAPILDSLTASRILATDGSKAVQSLDTATYPSLTELSYVKGVTSAIQTQIDSKISISKSILNQNHQGGIIGAGATSYGGWSGVTTFGAIGQEFARNTILPLNGNLKNWAINVGTQPATGSLVFTLRVNSGDTAMTITIAAGSATNKYFNNSTTIAVVQGDLVSFKVVNNASTSSGTIVTNSIMYEV